MTSIKALDDIRRILGPKGVVASGDADTYLTEWRDKFTGRAALIARPANTDEVSQILKIANEAGIGIVPQGGNTGLVGGQIPSLDGTEIILNLSRMNEIRPGDRGFGVDAWAATVGKIVEQDFTASDMLEVVEWKGEEAKRGPFIAQALQILPK